MKRHFALLLIALFPPLWLLADSFTYNYKGVDFKVRIVDGKAVVYAFDKDAEIVVIPAQVTDKKGKQYLVYSVDLGQLRGESTYDFFGRNTKTTSLVIESGIVEIGKNCFRFFKNLSQVYIPNTIEKIGKKAFNSEYVPTFIMPSSIKEEDLLAGDVIYPNAVPEPKIDPLASLDLSDYGQEEDYSETETLEEQAPVSESIKPGTSDIDYNIPMASTKRENAFCVIIANEVYKKKDTPNVKYAAQDGKTFQAYCSKTLGIPRENIRFAPNASYIEMKDMLKWYKQVGDEYGKDANSIVYFAGHGVPDEKGNCKLIPSDVSINDADNGFGLKELYSTLGSINSNSVLVLIDACFSGNDREDVAAVDDMHRGIVREVKEEDVTGDMVVLTAASGTETALSFDEKAHGLFSYYVMKKLQDTKGDVTFGQLYDYVKKEVKRKSIVAMGKKQTPSVTCSSKIEGKWKNLKL